jgi:membrane peptidoglycan carboxypeptidase
MSPYGLNDAFFHTIRDENVGFTRTIRIPPAQPVSVEWLAEHAERSMEEAREMLQRRSESSPAPRRAREPSLQLPDPTYRYVRLEDMSPWVVRAVLTAEDGDFFFHDGVNFYTLPRALARNLRAGEIRYGASTISMQVVKMLFLEDDRVFSRKLQEVLLVYLMEHEVPVSKPRILEIYLNIAEFGPGVFGISDAARYYFGKSPADLDAGEAVWLASILPSPKRYHRYYERGGISDGWFERMKSYFDVMLERERMSEDEYEQAVAEKPSFEK